MVSINIYRRLSSLFPRSLTKGISRLLVQGGFENLDSRTFVGFAFFFSLSAGLVAFFFSPLFFSEQLFQIALAIVFFLGSLALFYVGLSMSADARARQVEEVLPVALQMISANIRAGMTLENAIWSSARPEFGALSGEIKKMSADAFGGVPISQSLGEIPKRVSSQILARAFNLIIEGIVLGGEMAKLLDEVADDIRSTLLLQKEIAVATTTYAIFIVFASIIAAPLLFSVSTYYAVLNEQIAEKQLAGAQLPSEQLSGSGQAGAIAGLPGIGGQKAESSITPNDIRTFATASIALTAFFSALILGLIREGKATRGFKYIPVFMVVGLGVYFLFSSLLQGAFASFVK